MRTFPGWIAKKDDTAWLQIIEYEYVKHILDPIVVDMLNDVVQEDKIVLLFNGVGDDVAQRKGHIGHLVLFMELTRHGYVILVNVHAINESTEVLGKPNGH